MEISPNIGLGDLLIVKMTEVSNNLDIKKIYVSKEIAYTYRLDHNTFLKSTGNLLNLLFPKTCIELVDKKPLNSDPFNYAITKTYIYDNITIPKINIEYENYIIFHTKLRLDGKILDFLTNDINILLDFCKNFTTNYTIILMGEREIENNLEAKTHYVISLYNILLLLKKNNKLIDLTHKVLYSGNDNFDNFIREVEIINKANYNVTFGIGGQFVMCQAFSKKNYCFINTIKHTAVDQFTKINNNTYIKLENMLNDIK
jgi:hypothetical protein